MPEQWRNLLDSVAEFHGLIGGEEGTTMAIVQAYFDESGKLADSQHVCFGGVIIGEDDVRALNTRWNALLKDVGVKYLRMTEAINFRGEFVNWKEREAERDELLLALARVGVEFSAFLVAATSSTEAFRALPQERQRALKNPQYCGFEGCMTDIMQTIHETTKKPLVHLWCDSSEEYAKTCIELYTALRMRRPDMRKTFIAITFAEDEHFPPLQLADMYAYCHRSLEGDTTPEIVSELISILDERSERSQFGYRRTSKLGSGEFA